MYLWYLLGFLVLIIIELSTYNLITIWLAVSALLTGIYAYFFPEQIVVHLFLFLVFSIILLVLTKPIVKKMKIATEKTNADRLLGMEGVVLEDINPVEGTGQVKVSGQIWSAKAKDQTSISKGENVIVKDIQGVKLVVTLKGEVL
ncbi:MAG: NfeD family protein [Clostridia bacterium]|nr:NfeD family protein [Clostridia bacterium]